MSLLRLCAYLALAVIHYACTAQAIAAQNKTLVDGSGWKPVPVPRVPFQRLRTIRNTTSLDAADTRRSYLLLYPPRPGGGQQQGRGHRMLSHPDGAGGGIQFPPVVNGPPLPARALAQRGAGGGAQQQATHQHQVQIQLLDGYIVGPGGGGVQAGAPTNHGPEIATFPLSLNHVPEIRLLLPGDVHQQLNNLHQQRQPQQNYQQQQQQQTHGQRPPFDSQRVQAYRNLGELGGNGARQQQPQQNTYSQKDPTVQAKEVMTFPGQNPPQKDGSMTSGQQNDHGYATSQQSTIPTVQQPASNSYNDVRANYNSNNDQDHNNGDTDPKIDPRGRAKAQPTFGQGSTAHAQNHQEAPTPSQQNDQASHYQTSSLNHAQRGYRVESFRPLQNQNFNQNQGAPQGYGNAGAFNGNKPQDNYNQISHQGSSGWKAAGQQGNRNYDRVLMPQDRLVHNQNTNQYQGGGNQYQGGGSQHQGGGHQHQSGGHQHQGGGNQHQGGGHQHQGGGSQHQGGGSQHQGGGNQHQGGGNQNQGGGSQQRGTTESPGGRFTTPLQQSTRSSVDGATVGQEKVDDQVYFPPQVTVDQQLGAGFDATTAGFDDALFIQKTDADTTSSGSNVRRPDTASSAGSNVQRPDTASSASGTCECRQSCAPARSTAGGATVREIARTLNADAFFDFVGMTDQEIEALLAANGPYTLFVPSNEAVSRLPSNLLSHWKENGPDFSLALLNHVVQDAISLDQLKQGGRMESKARGATLFINNYNNEAVTVNGHRIVTGDASAPNGGGTLHVIDGTLCPVADRSVIDTLRSCNKYDGFLTLADVTGMLDAMQGDGPYTVFLPSNDALTKIPSEELAVLKENATVLREFLEYHIVEGAYFSGDLKDGQYLTTLHQRMPVRVGIRVDGCYRRLAEANNSPVFKADIPAKNGVIHVVDWVLRPNDLAWCEGVVLP